MGAALRNAAILLSSHDRGAHIFAMAILPRRMTTCSRVGVLMRLQMRRGEHDLAAWAAGGDFSPAKLPHAPIVLPVRTGQPHDDVAFLDILLAHHA